MEILPYHLLILACLSTCGVHHSATQPSPGSHNLQQGYLREGILYVAGPLQKNTDARISFWQANLRATKETSDGVKYRKFRDWCTDDDGFPTLRWRIAYGWIWSHQSSFGLESNRLLWEDLPLLDIESGDKGEIALRQKYGFPLDLEKTEIGWTHDYLSAPVRQMASDLQLERMKEVNESEFEFDFLPTGKNSYDAFVLFEEHITIFHVKDKVVDEKKDSHTWDLKTGDVVPAKFHEPFLAYGKPDAPYFVTKSGKLYHLVRPPKGKAKVECVWDDAKRPIATILTDTNSGRTFGLGVDKHDGKDKQRFYLEFVEKPEAVAINAEELPTVKVSEPLVTMLQFARYLDAKKKLTVPEH